MLADLRYPLRLAPKPEAYLASAATEPFLTPNWRRWPTVECVLGDSYANTLSSLAYGEIHYGDKLLSPGRYKNGYHTPEREWLIHYQRTGEERYFRLARSMARHLG